MALRPARLFAWSGATLLALVLGLTFMLRDVQITSWSVVWNALTGAPGPAASASGIVQKLIPRQGFHVELYSAEVPKARMLRLTSSGDLLVSQSREGQVMLLGRDADGDGRPDRHEVLLKGLDRPHGIDIADGWLYIGESGAVGRVPFDVEAGRLTGKYARILTGLPEGGNHWSRTVRIGPDGMLYVHVGSSCNACVEEHAWRATLLRANADGSQPGIHASGLRNSVGFDWAPWSGELYATDNGRDMLGDDFPPCELNRIEQGKFYGWPFINGQNVIDPEMGAGKEALLATAVPPAHDFRAHNAPLGIAFLRHQHDPRFARAALVALHGSWNRSVPDGYRVVLLEWGADGRIGESDFLRGFEKDGTVIGRPVDIAEAQDGTIYISDDYAGAIYRVRRGPAQSPLTPEDTPTIAAAADPLAGVAAAEIAAADARADTLMRQYACAGCHAAQTPMAARLATVDQRYTLDALSEFFVTPTPPMPIFPLSAADRRALAIHLLGQSSRTRSNSSASSAS